MKYIITGRQYQLLKESLDEDIMREMVEMYGHPKVDEDGAVESEDGQLIGFYIEGTFLVVDKHGKHFEDKYSILPRDIAVLFKNWVDSYSD